MYDLMTIDKYHGRLDRYSVSRKCDSYLHSAETHVPSEQDQLENFTFHTLPPRHPIPTVHT